MRSVFSRYFWIPTAIAGLLAAVVVGAVGLVVYVLPGLPSVSQLKQQPYQVPLRIFTADGVMIGEFGEKRSDPLPSQEIPAIIKQAVVAAEDDRFYEHPGVDYQGLLRAFWILATTGEATQGGSTITMQVARNFFLDRERTFWRKLREVLLAFKIERELGKDEILALYLNHNYLGNRAYGVAAASRLYFNKDIRELPLEGVATLVGLYKAPSKYNPLVNPERARQRRDYVIRRMEQLGFVTREEAERALAKPIRTETYVFRSSLEADYVAEMVRNHLYQQYGEEAYTRGLVVTTTIDSRLQAAANKTLRKHLLDFDKRQGFRGAEAHEDLGARRSHAELDALLGSYPNVPGLRAGVVLNVSKSSAVVYLGQGKSVNLTESDMDWVEKGYKETIKVDGEEEKTIRHHGSLKPGDIVRVAASGEGWRISQVPEINGALVSISTEDGRIFSLVGGYDYALSPFNRAVQAARQPGSSFKPFIFSAALAKGMTPASVIVDEAFTHTDPVTGKVWKPENINGKFYGPTRLREALAHSRNLVSVKLLDKIGVKYTLRHVEKFHMTNRQLPADLSLSLGTGELTPLELSAGYAVFANGGFRVEPYYIARIEDHRGNEVYRHKPLLACGEDCDHLIKTASGSHPGADITGGRKAERAIEDWNAYQMVSMMQDVIRIGTGTGAKALGRKDIAGKTGTTDENKDVWFSGFTPEVVTTVWMGFDQRKPLGEKATGGHVAVPVWVDYMRTALQGKPEREWKPPKGMVTVKIDAKTGYRLAEGSSGGVFETLREKNLSAILQGSYSSNRDRSSDEAVYSSSSSGSVTAPAPRRRLEIPEQIF